jgi:signal transduction histidine kinase
MRERLTAAFVVLSVLLLLGAGLVRSFVLRDLIREQEAQHLHEDAAYISQIVTDRQVSGDRVDRAFLKTLVDPDSRLVYAPDAGRTLVVTGRDYDGGDATDDLSASRQVSGGQVTVSQSPAVVSDIIGRDFSSVLVLFLMIAVVAGLIGYYVSTALSAPFRQLAAAAAALGRGRFDLDLPKTRIPEAQAIAQALGTSAGQLEDRLRRERDFAEHASHVLRTPLTGLRFELEDLAQRDDVPEDARVAATRGMKSVDEMNRVTGDLVQMARSGSLVAGAELPLVDLATQLAQRWADRLAVRGRSLTASAEGDLTLTYTPGPVEHVLDLVLADVVRRGTGAVRIVFCGQQGGLLRVKVASGGAVSQRYAGLEPADRLEEARTVAAALGGRIGGDDPSAGVEVLLPRR